MENFVLYEELGRDDHSIIYKGRRKGTIHFVAIHCVEKCRRAEVTNTVRMTHDISHDNIVQFYEWYETSNHLWLVVELCTGGSLETIISQDGYLPESSIRVFARDLAHGLHYLHSIGILFCDLNPAKVLMDGGGNLKFADFGLSRVESEDLDDLFHKFMEGSDLGENVAVCGTTGDLENTAPEVLTTETYTVASDLWAFGCLLYTMFSGHPPFLDEDDERLREKVLNQDLPPPRVKGTRFSSQPSPDFWDLLKSLLHKDPKHRMTWEELIRHPFWENGLTDLTLATSDLTMSHDVTSSNQMTVVSTGFVGVDEHDSSALMDKLSSVELLRPPSTLVTGGDLSSTSRPGSVIGDHMRPKTAPDGEGAPGLFTLSSRPCTATPPDDVDSPHRAILTPLVTTRKPLHGEYDSAQNLVKSLIYHSSDLTVTPIVDNPKIQKPAPLKYDPKTLPVPPYSVEKLISMSDKERTKHIRQTLDAVISPEKGPPSQKRFHLLNYLTVLANSDTIVAVLMEQSVILALNKLIKEITNIDIRQRLCRILGLVALRADTVDRACNLQEVFSNLSELTRDSIKTTTLREALLTAIGQLMYLVATQEDILGEAVERWAIPSMTYTLITRSLRDTEGVVSHIAAKVIESITATDTLHAQKFVSNETAQLLWCVFKNSTVESARYTALSALTRLTRSNPSVYQAVIDTVGLTNIVDFLKPPPTYQHTLLVAMFCGVASSGGHLNRFIHHKDFVQRVVRLLDAPSACLRAKIYLLVHELVSHSHEVLLTCCNNKFVTYIERDLRRHSKGDNHEMNEYLMQCVNVVVPVVIQSVPNIMQQSMGVLEGVQGRKHPSTAQVKQIKATLPFMCVVHHLLSSPVFAKALLTPDILQHTCTLLTYLLSMEHGEMSVEATLGANGLTDLNSSLLSIVDQLGQNADALTDNLSLVTSRLVPTLVNLIISHTLDLKVARISVLTQLVSCYLNQLTNHDSDDSFHQTLCMHLYPLLEQLMLDQDPTPCYILKLLHVVTSHSHTYVTQLYQHNIVPLIFHVWTMYTECVVPQELQTSGVTSTLHHLLGVVQAITHHTTTSLHDLFDYGILDVMPTSMYDIINVMYDGTSAVDGAAIASLQSLLDILHHILKKVSDVVRNALQMKKQDGGNDADDAEELLLTTKPLTDLTSSLIHLACHEEAEIRDMAIKCVSLLVQLYGGENHGAMDPHNLEYYSEALQLVDGRKQKVILRIIKRLITTNKDHLDCVQNNGDSLVATIRSLAKSASSHADMAVASLASEILKALT